MRKPRTINGGCSRCGSLKHALEEHNERMAEGRRKSALWRQRVLEGNARKRGKPITFSDPEGRREKLRAAASRSDVKRRVDDARKRTWANRTEAERRALGEKIAATQRGRKFTSEHLANLRKANAAPRSEEHKRKLGACHLGQSSWNKGLTKFTNASVLSTSVKQLGRVPDYNKYRAHYDGIRGKYLMRSRWEVAYAEYLDRQGIEWQYEPRWFNIGGGEWCGATYTPDFYLPASDEYIEIKGRMTEENMRKLKRFSERCPEIKLKVLQRAELTAMGLLDKHNRLIN